MKLLNKITAAICGAAMLAGIGQAVAGEDDGVFTIAYAPNESTTQSADARNGLAKDLGAYLAVRLRKSSQPTITQSLKHCVPAKPIWHIWVHRL